MSQELVAALVSGAFSILAVVISILANRKVEGLRNELLPEGLAAYKKLWSVLEPVTPTQGSPLPDGTREASEKSLRNWYYADGNGAFFSADAQERFLFARKVLRHEVDASSDSDLRTAFSTLRTQLKTDIEVYRGRDRTRKLG